MSASLQKFEETCPFLWSHRASPHLAPVFHLVEALDALEALTPSADFRSLTVARRAKFKPTNKASLLIGASLVRDLTTAISFSAENTEKFSASLRYGILKEGALNEYSSPFVAILEGFRISLKIATAAFYENVLLPNAKDTLDNFDDWVGQNAISQSAPKLRTLDAEPITDLSSTENPKTFAKVYAHEVAQIEHLYKGSIQRVLKNLIDGFLDAYTPPGFDWPLSKARRENTESGPADPASLSMSEHFALWVFMPALEGEVDCIEKSKRRLQAYAVYGILFRALIEPEISELIDAGKPIEMKLREMLGLNGHQLRFAKEVAARADLLNTLRGTPQTTRVITMLAASGVPLANWPEVFSQFNSIYDEEVLWCGSWQRHFSLEKAIDGECRKLARPSYGDSTDALLPDLYWKYLPKEPHASTNEHRDAYQQLERDVLWPAPTRNAEQEKCLAVKLYKLINHPGPQNIGDPLLGPLSPIASELYESARALYSTIHAAVVGDKTRSGFRKALLELHKFSPSIAAKRREIIGQEDTWPALFEPWCSADGRREIIFLKSTNDLVEEGLRMKHCVGSYDTKCLLGTTHIASVKAAGQHVATLEMHVSLASGKNALIIKKGQFASVRNAPPPPDAQRAFAEFMRDVADRRLSPNMAEVVDQIKKNNANDNYNFYRRSPTMRPLTIDEAEGLWPIYRATILSSYPEANSLREWRQASGIEDAFKRLETAIKREKKALAKLERDAAMPGVPARGGHLLAL